MKKRKYCVFISIALYLLLSSCSYAQLRESELVGKWRFCTEEVDTTHSKERFAPCEGGWTYEFFSNGSYLENQLKDCEGAKQIASGKWTIKKGKLVLVPFACSPKDKSTQLELAVKKFNDDCFIGCGSPGDSLYIYFRRISVKKLAEPSWDKKEMIGKWKVCVTDTRETPFHKIGNSTSKECWTEEFFADGNYSISLSSTCDGQEHPNTGKWEKLQGKLLLTKDLYCNGYSPPQIISAYWLGKDEWIYIVSTNGNDHLYYYFKRIEK